MKRFVLFVLPIAFVSSLQAQKIFSYVNEDGVKVFTNVGGRGGRSAPAPASASPNSNQAAAGPYSEIIQEVADRYGEDPNLIKAIISVESAFDENAVSVKNCKGLMQLHPDTAKHYGVDDVFNPAENIDGGVQYLQDLRRNYDDLELVLAAYNAGETAVKKYDGIPPYRETQNYVKKVMARFTPTEKEFAADDRGRQRVYRIVLPDGGLLLTNVPSREIEKRKKDGSAGLRGRNTLIGSD